MVIGDPINFTDLLINKDDTEISRGALYDAVSSRISYRLQELKVLVDKLALENSSEAPDNYQIHNNEYGYALWQQVDWEAFGMGNLISLEEEDNSHAVDELKKKPVPSLDHTWKANSFQNVRVGFSYEGGIVSRVRGYMNPTELMGFAARGLFMNSRLLDESCPEVDAKKPLNAWKQFFESNVFSQWNGI